MRTPDYFVDMGTPWCDWARTELELNNRRVIAGTVPFGSVAYSEDEVETEYPGFIKALEKLTELGCDRKFVTHILKFCIFQAQRANLATFLEQEPLLPKVEAALAIGLSGEEFVAAWGVIKPNDASIELPRELSFTTHT